MKFNENSYSGSQGVILRRSEIETDRQTAGIKEIIFCFKNFVKER